MRYRRLSYRYTMVVAGGRAIPFEDPWRARRVNVILAQPRWRPDADVYETATMIAATIDLAGVEHDDLDVLLFQDALVIEGERRLPACEEDGVYHAAAIRQGPFRVEVPLPMPIDPDRVDAHYEKGLLRITLPKAGGG